MRRKSVSRSRLTSGAAVLALFTSGLGLLTLACSGTSGSVGTDGNLEWKSGEPARVRLTDARKGLLVFELRNDAHSDRVEFYSESRDDATTKVTTDEVMDELLSYLKDQAFGRLAVDGTARGGAWTIEVEVGQPGATRVSHVAVDQSTPQKDLERLQACRAAIFYIYNNTFQAQTIQNEDGRFFFENPSQEVRRN